MNLIKLKEAQDNLVKLREEYQTLDKAIEDAQKILRSLEQRKLELRGTFGGVGLIALARLAVRNEQFPILREDRLNTTRIVAIDEKWITIRRDYDETEVKRYRRSDGFKENSRKESSWDKVNVEEVIKIWEDWHKPETTETKA